MTIDALKTNRYELNISPALIRLFGVSWRLINDG
jgi:hypothetical protein